MNTVYRVIGILLVSGAAYAATISGSASGVSGSGAALTNITAANISNGDLGTGVVVTNKVSLSTGVTSSLATTNISNGDLATGVVVTNKVSLSTGVTGTLPAANATGVLTNIQTFTSVASSATTVTTAFVKTNYKVTITPSLVTSSIVIQGYCDLANARPDQANVFFTLERNTTNLATTTGLGICGDAQAAITGIDCNTPIYWIDAPNSTSALTYEIYIKAGGGGATATWNNETSTCLLSAMELK